MEIVSPPKIFSKLKLYSDSLQNQTTLYWTLDPLRHDLCRSFLLTVAPWRSCTIEILAILKRILSFLFWRVFHFLLFAALFVGFSAVGFGYIVRCLPLSLSFLRKIILSLPPGPLFGIPTPRTGWDKWIVRKIGEATALMSSKVPLLISDILQAALTL